LIATILLSFITLTRDSNHCQKNRSKSIIIAAQKLLNRNFGIKKTLPLVLGIPAALLVPHQIDSGKFQQMFDFLKLLKIGAHSDNFYFLPPLKKNKQDNKF
jgi:hypothetical protein